MSKWWETRPPFREVKTKKAIVAMRCNEHRIAASKGVRSQEQQKLWVYVSFVCLLNLLSLEVSTRPCKAILVNPKKNMGVIGDIGLGGSWPHYCSVTLGSLAFQHYNKKNPCCAPWCSKDLPRSVQQQLSRVEENWSKTSGLTLWMSV